MTVTTDFVHLHSHSEYSPLDGLSTVKEMVAAVKADGQTALAFTDHGNCAVHPDAQIVCEAEGLKPIFGLEAYFVDDRFARGEDGKKITDYWHLILWAMDDEGLKNLWAMSTESYHDGLWGKYARLDWDTLARLNKGVMCSTACLGGAVLNPFVKGDEELAVSNLLRLKEIFGDRLYAEIQTGMQEDQLRGNAWLLEQAHRYDIEPVITCDSHYPEPKDKAAHKVWLASAMNKTLDELADSTMFEGNEDYHIMPGIEVRGYLGANRDYAEEHGGCPDYLVEILERAYTNAQVIADRCTAKIAVTSRNPVYSRATAEHDDPKQHDVQRLIDLCLENLERRTAGKQHSVKHYLKRLENELGLIIPKGFAGYFLMVWDLVSWAKRNGILVGPGRGSGGGSLVAYVLEITEIDPVEHDVLFERFMTKGRTELPDFDIDFPSTKKAEIYGYVAERWGTDNVATVGTHMRLKSKSVVQAVARAIKAELPEDHWTDMMACSAIIEAAEGDTAGLGLSWEDLWDRAGDLLQPFADKYPKIFEYAEKFHGRLKSYGKHPAGVIIDTDHPLTENLPLRQGEDGQMIAQFDLKVLELLGYVKFDLLNISNLDMIQRAIDLIFERTGERINPYTWTKELEDPLLYDRIGQGHCLGLFQIGSAIGTQMSRRMKPQGLHELADSITLVRPGPDRSGLKDLYLARRKGEEAVSYADPRMEAVLGKTWGAMIYQEQLMKLCMVLAGYDDVEADQVRRILGKKKVEQAKKEGVRFIERAMANGTDETVTRELWAQMEEFARYSFGFAHALAYAILGVWTAWFKFHYPLYFMCGALSTVKSEKLPAYIEETRRLGYRVLPPDINLSQRGFSLGDTGLDIRYGLDAIKGIGPVAVNSILASQPYTSWEDFIERRGPKVDAGHIKTMVRLGVFDSLEPNRRVLEAKLAFDGLPPAEQCAHRGTDRSPVWLPTPKRGVPSDPEAVEWRLPCSYDWEHEPDRVSERTGKLERRKAPPKKCTKGCRQWTSAAGPEIGTIAPYTDAQIRAIEEELLGVYLSSTPFDVIPAEDMDQFATADDVQSGPEETYTVAAVVSGVRVTRTWKGDAMAIITLSTPRGSLTAAAFPAFWRESQHQLVKGTLAYTLITKNDRGCALDTFIPIRGASA